MTTRTNSIFVGLIIIFTVGVLFLVNQTQIVEGQQNYGFKSPTAPRDNLFSPNERPILSPIEQRLRYSGGSFESQVQLAGRQTRNQPLVVSPTQLSGIEPSTNSFAIKQTELLRCVYLVPEDAAKPLTELFAHKATSLVESKVVAADEKEFAGLTQLVVTAEPQTQHAIRSFMKALFPVDNLKKLTEKTQEPSVTSTSTDDELKLDSELEPENTFTQISKADFSEWANFLDTSEKSQLTSDVSGRTSGQLKDAVESTGSMGCFLLILNDEMVASLREHGMLAAGLSPTDQVSITHIDLRGDDDRSDSERNQEPMSLVDESRDSEVVTFNLTDRMLEELEEEVPFRFEVPKDRLGKIHKVIVNYKRQ